MEDVKTKLRKIKIFRGLVKEINKYFIEVNGVNKKKVEYLDIIIKKYGIVDAKIIWNYNRFTDIIKIQFYDNQIDKIYQLKFIIKNNICV